MHVYIILRLCIQLLCVLCLSNTSANISESLLAMHPSDVLDMPVDPNEPTYCLCSQVSYGEMIGCDNSDVSNSYLRNLFFKPLFEKIQLSHRHKHRLHKKNKNKGGKVYM